MRLRAAAISLICQAFVPWHAYQIPLLILILIAIVSLVLPRMAQLAWKLTSAIQIHVIMEEVVWTG